MTERFRATIGVPGLPVREGFSGHIESLGFLPTPTSVETLRHIADTISGDGAFIMQGILRKAADELESTFDLAIKACEGEQLVEPTDSPDDIAYGHAVNDCIAAIRRLKGK